MSPPNLMPQLALVDRLQAQFEAFHRANPAVYATLVRLASGYADSGRRVGIGHLWEVMRWQLWVETRGDFWKLNNNWRSRYARLMMDQEPELAEFFETRRLRSAFDSGSARRIR